MLGLFPISARAKKVSGLLISIIIYVIIAFVVGFVIGLLSIGGIFSTILGIVDWVIRVYCGIGILVSLLVFLKVIK